MLDFIKNAGLFSSCLMNSLDSGDDLHLFLYVCFRVSS